MKKTFKYEQKHLDFFRENFKQLPIQLLMDKFNQQFGADLNKSQIASTLKRYKIQSGRTGRFEKGIQPWNTGTKGEKSGSSTSFQKGHRPHNWCPIGTERYTSKDRFIKVKTGEPNIWAMKHHLVWESKNGKIPTGMAVIFKDGNRENFCIDNLDLVSRGMLAQYNKHRVSDLPDELKAPMRTLVAIKIKQRKRERDCEQNT
jgi:HNH endonuclease